MPSHSEELGGWRDADHWVAEPIARYLRTEANRPAWAMGEVVPGDRDVPWAMAEP